MTGPTTEAARTLLDAWVTNDEYGNWSLGPLPYGELEDRILAIEKQAVAPWQEAALVETEKGWVCRVCGGLNFHAPNGGPWGSQCWIEPLLADDGAA